MSSNKKLQPPFQRLTVLVFGEAETEEAFLKHIRETYGRNTGLHVTVDCGNGSNPNSILNAALRLCQGRDFKRRLILLDTDIVWSPELVDKARKNRIELIPSKPCIEGFFLLLLEGRFNPEVHKSKKCKKLFEAKYLNERQKLDHRNYKKIFPKAKLEILRKKHPLLNRIIHIMTEI